MKHINQINLQGLVSFKEIQDISQEYLIDILDMNFSVNVVSTNHGYNAIYIKKTTVDDQKFKWNDIRERVIGLCLMFKDEWEISGIDFRHENNFSHVDIEHIEDFTCDEFLYFIDIKIHVKGKGYWLNGKLVENTKHMNDFEEFQKDFLLRKESEKLDFRNMQNIKSKSNEELIEEITNIFVDKIDKGYRLQFVTNYDRHNLLYFIFYVRFNSMKLFNMSDVNDEINTIKEYFGFNTVDISYNRKHETLDSLPDKYVRYLKITMFDTLPLKMEVEYGL